MGIIQDKQQLPNATAILVLGILSLVFCWCYGIIGLVLGILAVVLSITPQKVYSENPDAYTEVSYKNLNAGKICGIIGIVISAFILLVLVVAVFTMREVNTASGLFERL